MTLASAQSGTATARLRALFDQDTLRPTAPSDDDGAVAGRGTVDGTQVIAFAATTRMGEAGCRLVVDTIDAAIRERLPVVGLWDCGGGAARLAGDVATLDAVGQVLAAVVRASGRVPQLSVVLGPAAYGPALTDIVIMSDAGAEADAARPGVAHVRAGDDAAALATARELAVLLGRQGRLRVDDVAEADLGALLPPRHLAYDVRPLIERLLDAPGVELHAGWAPNVVTTLGRFGGRTVGVVANNPLRLGGCLDVAAAEKAARFVRTCDALGVPLVVLADVPGYLPGPGREPGDVVLRGAKLLHAFAEAVVPRVTLVTRRAYGGAYIAMNSRSLGATAVLAWPDAEIAVMGAAAAVDALHRERLAAAPHEEREQLRARLIEEQAAVTGVDRALKLGMVDAVIRPELTRGRIAAALADAPAARGAHGNIPL